jgi:hypothetical protein
MTSEPLDLLHIFADPNFKWLSERKSQELGLRPHRAMYSKAGGGILVLMLKCLPGEEHFRMYAWPLKAVCELQQAGVVAECYLVQYREGTDGYEFIASKPASEVRDSLKIRLVVSNPPDDIDRTP